MWPVAHVVIAVLLLLLLLRPLLLSLFRVKVCSTAAAAAHLLQIFLGVPAGWLGLAWLGLEKVTASCGYFLLLLLQLLCVSALLKT